MGCALSDRSLALAEVSRLLPRMAAPDGGGRLAGCGGRSPRRLPLPRRPAAASTRLRPVRVCTLPVALRCPG